MSVRDPLFNAMVADGFDKDEVMTFVHDDTPFVLLMVLITDDLWMHFKIAKQDIENNVTDVVGTVRGRVYAAKINQEDR